MSEGLFVQKHVLTLEAANKAADAAVAAAKKAGIQICVSVVDESGNLLAFQKMDQAVFGAIDACIAKAKSAAKFKMETMGFQDGLQNGTLGFLTLGILGFGGGVPIEYNNTVVGAIGVGGGSADDDAAAAKAGIAAIVG